MHVAAKVYKTFEKSLEDSRRNTQTNPKGSTMGLGFCARTGGGSSGRDRMCWTKATSLSEGFPLGQASDLHCLSKVG